MNDIRQYKLESRGIGEYHFTLHLWSHAESHGTDFGPGPYKLLAVSTKYFAMKVKGHMTWGGVGQDQEYEPSRVYVFAITKQEGAEVLCRIALEIGRASCRERV